MWRDLALQYVGTDVPSSFAAKVFEEANMTHNRLIDDNALDRLVVLQLGAIIDNETKLRQRYSSLLESSSVDEWKIWTQDMQRLQTQADRLGRMVGALDGTYYHPQHRK